MPFYKPYETPQPDPDSERTPEIIEAEMKALEVAMDALVLLTLKSVCANFFSYIFLLTQTCSKNLLKNCCCCLFCSSDRLPDSVFWFEPPVVAHWLPEKRIWSTKDIHDIKYNEEKQTIAFRTGRLGIHGLAGYKYANLPFQSWELKPESKKSGCVHIGVILTVTAAIVQVEFVIRVLSPIET